MWNTRFSNSKCNELNKIKEHKMHLERIVTAKSTLDVKEPSKPSFLAHRAKKEKMEEERQRKIYNDNIVLVKKIIEINNKPSPYNVIKCQMKRCPAFDKTDFQIRKKQFNIDVENTKLYKRLVSAKPFYKTDEVIKDYARSKYFESMISQTKNNKNPSLLFETPYNFKKRFENYMMSNTENIPNNPQENTNEEVDEIKQRSLSANRISNNKPNQKKPLSGITRSSASTNYTNAHNDRNNFKVERSNF